MSSGPDDLTGGGNHWPDTLRSNGWRKIPARDSIVVDEQFSSLHVRAYAINSKQWFQVHAADRSKWANFFYKLDNFSESFYSGNGYPNAVKAKGGELKPYYPKQAYFNGAAKRYELTGPNIQGGEPNAPLPAAVAKATFINLTKERVFFTVTTGGQTRQGNLAPGQSTESMIQMGQPMAYVTISQSDGSTNSFSLPEGANYAFRMANGKIQNQYK